MIDFWFGDSEYLQSRHDELLSLAHADDQKLGMMKEDETVPRKSNLKTWKDNQNDAEIIK